MGTNSVEPDPSSRAAGRWPVREPVPFASREPSRLGLSRGRPSDGQEGPPFATINDVIQAALRVSCLWARLLPLCRHRQGVGRRKGRQAVRIPTTLPARAHNLLDCGNLSREGVLDRLREGGGF